MKQLPLIAIVLWAFFAPPSPVLAVQHSHKEEMPDFDKRQEQQQVAAKGQPVRADKKGAVERLQRALPQAKADFDAITGSPRSVRARDGYLSGRAGKGRGISENVAATIPANDPHHATKAFVKEHRELFGHGPEALENARVKRDYVTSHNGLKTTVWEQEVDGIAVFDGTLLANTTRDGELVMISSRFMGDPAQAADRGVKNRRTLMANPQINSRRAALIAVKTVEEDEFSEEDFSSIKNEEGAAKTHTLKSAKLTRDVDAKLVWLPVSEDSLRLCWEIVFSSPERGESFVVLVDAETGEPWLRRGLTFYISDASYRVFTSDSPTPFSPGSTTPSGYQPPEVSRVLVVTNALNTNASPNGWINDGINFTVGNNVDAYLDANNDNSPDGGMRVEGSSFRVFDYPLNLSLSPSNTTNQMAAVANLFYWCNWMHDKLYDLGFDEAAGNFQVDNFGRGGTLARANDPVQAEAQDGSGFNNANFETYGDGSFARMQMYIFSGATPTRDSSLDAEVILHEYAHGLSMRLVGGGASLLNEASRGLGEGWSDFYALSLLSGPQDDLGGNYAIGAYVMRGVGGAAYQDNYYYGYRRYPYSTNLSKNPLTFKDIDPSQASNHQGVQRNPSPAISTNATEVHNMGEVWCAILWEARANFINKYGFTNGNQMILQLVTDAMRLTPPQPNFIDARDAIFDADRANNGGVSVNARELWMAFAKRGMGFFASAPANSTTTVGIVESYTADDLDIVPYVGPTLSAPVGGPFLPATHLFAVTNRGPGTLSWQILTNAAWLNFSLLNGAFAAGTGTNISVTLNTAIINALPSGIYTNTITFSNQTTGINQTREFTLRIGQPDSFTEIFDRADLDVQDTSFTFTPDNSPSAYSVCRSVATDFPTDPAGGTVVPLADEDSQLVNISSSVSLYGTPANSFFIGSNGYLTFGAADNNYLAIPSAHFGHRRIAALMRDLNPATNGAVVSWKQTTNLVAVTYQNVPLYGSTTTNNFQIEMFYDGRIRITYLRLDARNGLIGLSAGTNTPNSFIESDFTSYPNCAPNVLLTLPATATEGAGVLAAAGQVTIPWVLSSNLLVYLNSSDSTEVTVPESITVLAGETNASFPITIVDDGGPDGTQTANITATVANNYFLPQGALISVYDNENVILTLALPSEVNEDGGSFSASITINQSTISDVVVTLSSTNATEITVPSTVTIPSGQTSAAFNVVIINDSRIDNDQIAGLTAHVENWTDGIGSLTVRDDENKNLTVVLPASVWESNGTLPAAGLVRISGTLPTNLVVSLLSADTDEALVSTPITIIAGKTAAVFDITAFDDALFDGVQAVQISASAPGFNPGEANLNVADDETPPAPVLLSPRNSSDTNATTVSLSWSPGLDEGIEQINNGSFESGDFSGWTLAPGLNGNIVIDDGAYDENDPVPPAFGNFSALLEATGSGAFLIYQDVAIPTSEIVSLRWSDQIRNLGGDSFSESHQFRVELRDTNDVPLRVVYCTDMDTAVNQWTDRSFNVSEYRGQTIRVAFIVVPELALDVHLDNISLRTANPAPTLYEVYFGTSPSLTIDNLQGDTSDTVWELPALDPLVTYYWKVAALRLGTTESATWQFSTIPFVSVGNASVLEGHVGTTVVGLEVTLSAPSQNFVTVNYTTVAGTASETDFVPAGGTVMFSPGQVSQVVMLHVVGDDNYESNEVFSVILSNPSGAVSDGEAGNISILNDDPFLAPIQNVTINEQELLTFTARAATVSPVVSTLITDFENFPVESPNGSVMFRQPGATAPTSQYLSSGVSNTTLITSDFPAGHTGTRVAKSVWRFNGSTNSWVRLTTDNASNLPHPTVDFHQVIQFDIYTDKALRLGLGLRETASTNVMGANGGNTGSMEFVGVTNLSSFTPATPSPSRTIAASNWQTVSFNLPYETVVAHPQFSGNGVLESSTGKGVLEHLALVPAAGTGYTNTYNVYLDNFSVIYSNVLTFSLSDAPTGASIHPKTGVFSWTPTEAQGPGVYTMTVHVTDLSVPPITDSRTFTVTVSEANRKPTIGSIGPKTVTEGNTLTFTNTATDLDFPANTLSYSLDPGFPAGASVNPTTGVFTWTPSEAQGPGSFQIIVRVTDNAASSLSDSRSVQITVLETNRAPVLSPLSDHTIGYGGTVSFTALATDSDAPPNTLIYSLVSPPPGASINATNGMFSWSPSAGQTPSTNVLSLRVTDNGTPSASDTKTFTVYVTDQPRIRLITLAGQTLNLEWSSISNRIYRVQYKTNLTDLEWSTLPGDVTAQGETASKTDSIDSTLRRFYRIELLP